MTITLRTLFASIGAILIAVYVTDVFLSIKNSPSVAPAHGTSIASGSQSGTYHRFATTFSSVGENFVDVKITNGSIENLELLRAGEVDFAIIQSDAAHFAYHGLKNITEQKNIRLVAPLFEERIRLYIIDDGSIDSLRDLFDQNICVGAVGSGTYFNAVSVLNEIGLIADVDFNPIYVNSTECLEIAKRMKISAIFQTSHFPLNHPNHYKEKILPLSVIDKVIERNSYYRRHVTATDYHLAVDAYLVATTETSNVESRRVVYSLQKNWNDLRSQIPSLPEEISSKFGGDIPKHNGVVALLGKGSSARTGLFLSPWVLSFWIGLLLLCLYAERQKSTYNRLGERTLDAWAEHLIINIIGKFSQILIAISIAFFAIVVAVFALKFSESVHAKAEGVQSQFLDLNFVDSLMWLFSYISSGFTAEGIYPSSTIGQLVVALLAIAVKCGQQKS